MTHLRKMMLEELERRNYAQTTIDCYIQTIEDFARHFRRPPDQLTPEHIREYQAYLFRERKLAASTVTQRLAALRFFYTQDDQKSLERGRYTVPEKNETPTQHSEPGRSGPSHRLLSDSIPSHGIDDALWHGGTARELARLQISDIDSRRMVIHIRGGKGRQDRDVMLSPRLLEALRDYWRGLKRKPTEWLFPGGSRHTSNRPITPRAVWYACERAAQRAGLQNRVHPHTLRHCFATHLLENGADLRTIRLLPGTSRFEGDHDLLHLSRRHLHATASPLDSLKLKDKSPQKP